MQLELNYMFDKMGEINFTNQKYKNYFCNIIDIIGPKISSTVPIMNEYTTRKMPIKNHRHRNVATKMMGGKVVIGFPPKFPLKVKYTLNTVEKHFIKCSDSCIQVKALRQVSDPRRSYVGAKGWLIPLLYQGILTSKTDFGQMNRVLLFRPHILGKRTNLFT